MNRCLVNKWQFPELLPNRAAIVMASVRAFSVSSWGESERSYLSEDEVTRLDRIKHEATRQQYWLARVLLRQWLAQTIGCRPQDVALLKNENGRPYLHHPNLPLLDFNISHGDEWVVIALACGQHLGVDIENEERSTEVLTLADRFFHPKEAAYLKYLSVSEQKSAFFSIWTAKEAYVKALGTGLQTPLDSFVVDLKRKGEELSHLSLSEKNLDGSLYFRGAAKIREAAHQYFWIFPYDHHKKLIEANVCYWRINKRLHLSFVPLAQHKEECDAVDLWLQASTDQFLLLDHRKMMS